jgi:hypothetical protein
MADSGMKTLRYPHHRLLNDVSNIITASNRRNEPSHGPGDRCNGRDDKRPDREANQKVYKGFRSLFFRIAHDFIPLVYRMKQFRRANRHPRTVETLRQTPQLSDILVDHSVARLSSPPPSNCNPRRTESGRPCAAKVSRL